jgi:hypothetical protein
MGIFLQKKIKEGDKFSLPPVLYK